MNRSQAVIAVAAAVALAAAVVTIGVVSDGAGVAAGAATGDPAGSLPEGHPSVAAETPAAPETTTSDEVARTIARLEKASTQEPDNVDVLLDLGDAYYLGQRLRQADRVFSRALHEDPRNPTAKVKLAMVWHAEGDSARAEAALRAVVAARPDHQEAHYSLAIVAFSAGRVDEAKTEWETAARIDPSTSIGRRSQSFVDLLEDQGSAITSSGQ